MDASEVLGVVGWALGGVVLAGLSLIAWLHRQHRELERRVGRIENENEKLEPIRRALEEASFKRAEDIAGAVSR
ncbi:MAG TPA: hypothetical protein VM241_05505 [Candidatus Thermoplasmatota archaeon]|nr:hypothetical protein [Candidatus Thermoplasmatota archaeon]